MKKLILYIILSFTISIQAQTNLLSNGDFELFSSLPSSWGQCNFAIGWNNINGNYSGSPYASPDFFYNPIINILKILGPISPFSGNGQMGLVLYDNYSSNPNFREYISSSFINKMYPNHLYKISYNLTNGVDTFATLASNNFGIHFSNSPLIQLIAEPIYVKPQIEIDTIIYFWNYWQHFSFNYMADSSYKFITIGNFRDDAHTLISLTGKNDAYYFIDKIEIIPILNIIGDSTICKGDTTILTATVGNNIKWAAALQPNIIISTDSILKVNPIITTAYLAYNATDTAYFTVNVVSQPNLNFGNDITLCNGTAIILNARQIYATYQWQDGSTNPSLQVTKEGKYWVVARVTENCYATDTINISYRNCDFPGVFIPNTFTPDGDGLNDVFSISTEVEFSSFKIKIFNRREQQIYESDDAHFRWDATFKGSPVSSGAYMYYIEATDKLSNKKLSYKGSITVLY
jgi:gliding motility-associated-like protein